MAHVRSFPPIAHPSSRVLILGSMPGKASLAAGQYYAHPRNGFWRIVGELFGADPDAPYSERVEALRERGVALWDVLASCFRTSSLDSDIDEGSIVVNDFAGFLATHPKIRAVFFNGAKAEAAWRKYVLPELPAADALAHHRLPSTSPAHASLTFEQKLAAWTVVRRAL